MGWVVEDKFLQSHRSIIHRDVVDGIDDIAITEALIDKDGVIIVAEVGVAEREFILAPMGEDSGEDEKSREEIDEDAATDDAEPLPSGFRTILPRLRVRREIVGRLGLIDHTGDVAIAAERKPTDAPEGIILIGIGEILLLPCVGFVGVKKEEMPFTVKLFSLKDRKLRVKEKIKAADAGLEKLSKAEMTQFMSDDKEREAEEESKDFHTKNY